MAGITRLGDNSSGHDSCPPVPLITASDNVFINGKGAGRVGDSYAIHSCRDHSPHSGTISSGSNTVFVNGKKLGRIGDSVSCGGSVANGSSNVFAN